MINHTISNTIIVILVANIQNHTMRKLTLLLFIICTTIGCKKSTNEQDPTAIKQAPFAIIIHGGAGTILKKNMTPVLEKAYEEKLTEAVTAGHKVLKNGGNSTLAVATAIKIMENSPLFNAGKGSVFTHGGENEMDASIMEGKTLQAGAITGVKTVKNPILGAIEVMQNSAHVLLSGKGADEFSEERGLEIMDPSYFYTKKRFDALQRVQNSEKEDVNQSSKISFYDTDIKNSKYGTVGCVALDQNGNITAGTSTGGMTNKRWNRIGDAPIIGAGTYANNETCGVSSTGWGEYFIRGVIAHDIAAQMEYKKVPLKEATRDVIQNKLTKAGGTGGIIALDKDGNMSFEFNTAGMYRASIDTAGALTVKIYK